MTDTDCTTHRAVTDVDIHNRHKCKWCDRTATTTVTYDDSGYTSSVCGPCARDFNEWQAEERRELDRLASSAGYDGPHYADTMSGGIVYLGG